MIEQRLPVIARWMLYALGAVEGKRIHRPLDPVAAWLLKRHPELLPSVPQPALLSTIRARTEIVDALIDEEVHFARQRGEDLCTWSFGGGFDARWHRLIPQYADVIREHREVESPAILELKSRLLAESPYAEVWRQVGRRALPEDRWVVQPRQGTRPLVLVETGAGRLEDEQLRQLLYRIRQEAPEARVLLGLPGAVHTVRDSRWTVRAFAQLGWRFDVDVNIAVRGRLLSPDGGEVCPGMYPFRVVRLLARERLQS